MGTQAELEGEEESCWGPTFLSPFCSQESPAESQAFFQPTCVSPSIMLGTGKETEAQRCRGPGQQPFQPGTPSLVPPSWSPLRGLAWVSASP